jgi:alpha-mannosidase
MLEELIILLPCHSLDDFPVHHTGDEAEGLLAAWSALWHPALLAAAGCMPTWYRADSPPETLENRLLVIPAVSEAELQAGYAARAQEAGAIVVRKMVRRDEIIAAALAALPPANGSAPSSLDPEIVADFLALSFIYLQVELLTRRIRYMSVIDETHFQNLVADGAKAAVTGDSETARERLLKCLDVLTEAREHVYPTDIYFFDLTLVAGTTLGPALAHELAGPLPCNVLISGQTTDELARQDPETLSRLREGLAAQRLGLVGGDWDEAEHPLLDLEAIFANFQRAATSYQKNLGRQAIVYGRRRFGLTPVLPQVLSKFGFTSALLATLDEGRIPFADQSKTRWEGVDGSVIDVLGKPPVDASLPETFLGLSAKLADGIHHDHVACLAFAHWPGQGSPWYDDLRRIHALAPVLGKFVTIESFFQETDAPWQLSKFSIDDYRSPYLRQAIIRRQSDPISRIADQHERQSGQLATSTLTTICDALVGGESFCRQRAVGEGIRLPQELANRLAGLIPRQQIPAEHAYLVINPSSFARQAVIDADDLRSLPQIGGPVLAAGDDQTPSGKRRRVVVDLPPLGFAWIGAGHENPVATPPKRSWWRQPSEPPWAEGTTIRNEHIEVVVNPTTGAIQAIHDFRHRGTLMSQQIAMRLSALRPQPGETWRDPNEDAQYSVMAADAVEITSAGPVLMEITSRGRLLDHDGRRLAGFVQRTQLPRASRVIRLEIELDVTDEPRSDPWLSYYAARFAWSDPAAALFRGVAWGRHQTEAARLEAPHFIEIQQEKVNLAILTGGLPYHQIVGMRMLDTLLVVRGESRRRFRLAIAVDEPNVLAAALERFEPPLVHREVAAPPQVGPTSWFFHTGAKNVIATHWEPLYDDNRVAGVRVRMLETLGRPTKARLAAFRPFTSARQLDLAGTTLVETPIEDGRAVVEMTAHEWVQLEARWQA